MAAGYLSLDRIPRSMSPAAPDGSFYIADRLNNRIRAVTKPLPGFSVSDIAIASEDGSLLYQFDSVGRHLRTLNALDGADVERGGEVAVAIHDAGSCADR